VCDENDEFARRFSHVGSPWLSGEEWVSIHLEQTSLLLAVGTLEGVDRWTNPNVDETDLGQHFLPGCTRQTTGNSSRPQVNVFERRFGDRLAVRNVGKLESPAWAQHTPYFGEHGSFIGAQIDDAVADDDIGQLSSTGKCSASPSRNSTFDKPSALAVDRDLASISSVMSTPTILPLAPT
jgi:hypothetical protein